MSPSRDEAWERLHNTGYVCPEHAPRPQPHYVQMDPLEFVGHTVKRAFAEVGTDCLEHMWVTITRVTADGQLEGRLDNDPLLNVGVVYGDTVLVSLTDIEDVE